LAIYRLWGVHAQDRELMQELDLVTCPASAVVHQDRVRRRAVNHTGSAGRDFTADARRCKLVGNITYIPSWAGWLYLATVIDCVNLPRHNLQRPTTT
jgi:hypothetical protein